MIEIWMGAFQKHLKNHNYTIIKSLIYYLLTSLFHKVLHANEVIDPVLCYCCLAVIVVVWLLEETTTTVLVSSFFWVFVEPMVVLEFVLGSPKQRDFFPNGYCVCWGQWKLSKIFNLFWFGIKVLSSFFSTLWCVLGTVEVFQIPNSLKCLVTVCLWFF